MTRVGDLEPVLVGPWTMGRDKKSPKPLDQPSFMTLVKGANEVMLRHEQAAHSKLHKAIAFTDDDGRRIRATLDVARDDDDPHAILATFDETSSEAIRTDRVSVAFALTAANVTRWIGGGEG